MPKYVSDIVEGALIAEYYEEEKDHDVIFIGDFKCIFATGQPG